MTCVTVKYNVNIKQSFGFGFGLFSFLRFLNLIIINNNIFINFGEYIYIYISQLRAMVMYHQSMFTGVTGHQNKTNSIDS